MNTDFHSHPTRHAIDPHDEIRKEERHSTLMDAYVRISSLPKGASIIDVKMELHKMMKEIRETE